MPARGSAAGVKAVKVGRRAHCDRVEVVRHQYVSEQGHVEVVRGLVDDSRDHRAHLRLAYVYLSELDVETAQRAMRDALRAFLEHHGVDPGKYHETLTRAWILAVRHFMAKSPGTESADELIEKHPEMLDPKIMKTHYSTELLFSPEARASFVDPDLDPIPRYES